ncbi:hypothetical protein ACFSBZ_16955 [Amnibacterium flavum]|uniref:PrgI family protein n=1 Tax=Amnibacterium flavum TaxID=2173173 RepID=A0A2V1HL80_9MICO|nr:hypothetical protein [Amnibacterium flavum]PVZ93185.1 hypothetical protein DDQ50_16815 [Amnibacterium flavum]
MSVDTTRGGVSRVIGGESGHRSFFGGTHSRGRVIAFVAAFLAAVILTPLFGIWGLLIALLVGGGGFLLTQRTHRGSILDRRTRRTRWAQRLKDGTDRFEPYTAAQWDERTREYQEARDSAAKRAAWKQLSALRATPDGADGMGWLHSAPNEPGIAWHAPVGEPNYLSVTFTVTGQMSGVESSSVMRRAAEGWGMFLASRAAPTSLVGDVQMLTRVLPADSTPHEAWVADAQDPTAPLEAKKSYEQVLRIAGGDAMVQRHFVTVSWPITAAFIDAAKKYGPGRDGWRGLMQQEIASTVRGLIDARVGQVETLSARRLGAVMLHQQNPSRPIDQVAGVNPAALGLPSHDEFSAHVVDGIDPSTGKPVEWWHRTAAIRAENLAVGARGQLWLLDLLIGADIHFVRSLAFHVHLVPNGEARESARRDLLRDRAAAIEDAEKGRLANDVTGANMSAAARRDADLAHGSPHHGGTWVGYVTISETSRSELMKASRSLEETCSTGLGIERLEWLDSYQSAASGTTWPIGRGLGSPTPSLGTRLARALAGTSEKESL